MRFRRDRDSPYVLLNIFSTNRVSNSRQARVWRQTNSAEKARFEGISLTEVEYMLYTKAILYNKAYAETFREATFFDLRKAIDCQQHKMAEKVDNNPNRMLFGFRKQLNCHLKFAVSC